MNLKEYYKKILSEASERRMKRVERSVQSAENRFAKSVGLAPEPQSFMDMLANKPKTYDYYDMHDLMMDRQDDPLVRRLGTLYDVSDQANEKDHNRLHQIASKLKTSNLKMYNKYAAKVKPAVLDMHQRRLDDARDRLQKTKSMNAPQFAIDHAQQYHDNILDEIKDQIHTTIAGIHKLVLRDTHRPKS
jgi:hypothetical protein